jgi:hypothetical protein
MKRLAGRASTVVPAALLTRALVPRALVRGVFALALAVDMGCTPVRPPSATATLPPAAPVVDPSDDWHGLVPAAFGTAFAALHDGLHEVLLFRDAAPGAATNAAPDGLDGDECYRSNAPGPRFVGRVTTDYLWCFRHDRLERVAAVVRLPTAEAPDAFARHCARWLEHADDAERTAMRCAGRDGPLAFSAQLLDAGPDSATELAIVVYATEEH